MYAALLLLAMPPHQHVPERVEAALPTIAEETRGLVSDRPTLAVDLAALFDDDDDSALPGRDDGPVERLTGMAREERFDPSEPAPSRRRSEPPRS